ncbi:MAG: MopE-related protein [Myxococcota bacterium]
MAARPPAAPSQPTSTRRIPGLLSLSVVGGILAGFIGGACATSDQMLEKQRRRDELDAGPSCYSGVSEDCYTGPEETAGRGACRLGQRTCENGVWGTCTGEVVPTQDLCNNVDDDCDGIVDNGFEREGALCFLQGAQGVCRTQGRWRCSEDGTQSTCDAPIVKPTAETCNGLDDDCDGEIDEDAVPEDRLACTTGKAGVCNAGTNKCVQGTVRCVQDVQPGAEICNGLDDNCNNTVDEECAAPPS